ncbi:hypothetical protein [Polymorphospora sp. A560]
MTETETGMRRETTTAETGDRNRRDWTLRPALPSATTETETPTPTAKPTRTRETTPTTETKPSRYRQWRDRRAATNAAKAAETAETRAAALEAATRRDQTDTTQASAQTETETDLAPMPVWLRWLGIWVDRLFGSLPLAAPLVVSGVYTIDAFTDQPLNAHPVIALAATCALEGGVWKLGRLYEKTLVAGDSTIAIRIGIGIYLALISGLIYWHADHEAKAAGRTDLGTDALPAFGVAVMSALGVYIWSRTARWQRRKELVAAGRVDRQAPKFAALAWALTPIETATALRHAVRFRIESPTEAIKDRRLYVAAGRPAVWPPAPQSKTTPTAETAARPRPETVIRVQAETGKSVPQLPAVENAPAIEAAPQTETTKPKTASVSRGGLHLAGKPTDDEYVRMVQDRFPEGSPDYWASPSRRQPVSAGEVMAATGLKGKETARRIQRLVHGAARTIQTGRRENADPAEERPTVGAQIGA